MNDQQLCFCGATSLFSQCCQPLLLKSLVAKTPEQLMRSRFSAYAVKDFQYIFDTYAKSSQTSLSVEGIAESAQGCHWFALVIYPSDNTVATTNEHEQYVEFSAFYFEGDKLCEMREKSRFIIEKDNKGDKSQWRYLDGEIMKHQEIAKVTRNQLCPCNEYPSAWTQKKGKKFKQCCAKANNLS